MADDLGARVARLERQRNDEAERVREAAEQAESAARRRELAEQRLASGWRNVVGAGPTRAFVPQREPTARPEPEDDTGVYQRRYHRANAPASMEAD